jgi:hypothetical protein
MTVRTLVEHGIEYRHEELPEGWAAVDVYEQCHTVVPDHGGSRALELKAVLEAAGITARVLTTHRKRASVLIGSGPGGSVRFGDDMMHSIHRVAVPAAEAPAAHQALQDHERAVCRWLYEGAPMPEACRR